MSKYEDMVYKCPGPHSRPHGTFATKGVNSVEEHEATLKDGWHNTLPDAIAYAEGKLPPKAAVVDNAPPTRAELEQKAKELNIKFDKNTKDETLAKKIAEALGA